MPEDRSARRLRDVLDAIADVRGLLEGRTLADIVEDRVARAALERFLEVISEASRHVTPELKEHHPNIPWRQIADVSNHLRHAYHRTDPEILWNVYQHDLGPLEAACADLLARAGGSRPDP